MTARARLVACAAIALGATACANVLGLGDYGDAPDDAGIAPATADDASIDARTSDGAIGPGADGAIGFDASGGDAACSPVGTASCFAIPGGWTFVAFVDGATPPCPAGFSANAPLDLFGGAPTAGAGACTCDACTVTTPPTCEKGSIAVSYDTNGDKSCDMQLAALGNANAGACNTDNYHGQIGTAFDVKFVPPGPSGGACTATATRHAGAIAFPDSAIACSADDAAAAGCSGGACAPTLPSPFAACVAQSGNVACPGAPFTVAHHLVTGATFDCGATCTCTTTATCTGATVTYYGDANCQSVSQLATPANGTCVNQGGKGGTYGSYKYAATASNPSCATAGTSAASNVTTTGDQTICCAP